MTSSHTKSFIPGSSQDAIDLDHTPLTFGKYRGQTPDEISEHDPSYIVWMHRNIGPTLCSEWLYDVCKDEMHTSEDDSEEFKEL